MEGYIEKVWNKHLLLIWLKNRLIVVLNQDKY